mmetsp:Transcript_13972/g.22822  ORF Transcript_13972/g.22822 Transcript_13972/m.22822 type:complete len:234 (+) Transcript_13972:1885-2586(+)
MHLFLPLSFNLLVNLSLAFFRLLLALLLHSCPQFCLKLFLFILNLLGQLPPIVIRFSHVCIYLGFSVFLRKLCIVFNVLLKFCQFNILFLDGLLYSCIKLILELRLPFLQFGVILIHFLFKLSLLFGLFCLYLGFDFLQLFFSLTTTLFLLQFHLSHNLIHIDKRQFPHCRREVFVWIMQLEVHLHFFKMITSQISDSLIMLISEFFLRFQLNLFFLNAFLKLFDHLFGINRF